jgi:hypothetical protein
MPELRDNPCRAAHSTRDLLLLLEADKYPIKGNEDVPVHESPTELRRAFVSSVPRWSFWVIFNYRM